MSDDCDQLIAQRDTLIETLQGQWVVETDRKAIRAFALRSGMYVGFVLCVVLACIGVVATLQNPNRHITLTQTATTVAMIVVGISAVVAAIVACCVLLKFSRYRRYNPMVITGTELVWDKRKGFVPERLDLQKLLDVVHYQGDGVDAGRLVYFLTKRLDPYQVKALSPCIFVATGNHNPPRFSVGMFRDGERLISTLKAIAAVNTAMLNKQNGS